MTALQLQSGVSLYRLPTDTRKSFDSLVTITGSALKQEPLSDYLFVFFNRRRDRIKILYWGQIGFCTWYQQLQQETYPLPSEDALKNHDTVAVTRWQRSLI